VNESWVAPEGVQPHPLALASGHPFSRRNFDHDKVPFGNHIRMPKCDLLNDIFAKQHRYL